MAAPSLYNESISKRICDRISKGDSFTGACILEGIHEATGRNWRESKPEFLRAVQEAQEKRKSTLVEALYSGIDKHASIEVTTLRIGEGPAGEKTGFEEIKTTIDHGARVRYAMWALPRIDPDNWSEEAKLDKKIQAGIREWVQYLMSAVDDHSKTQIATALLAAGFEASAIASTAPAQTANTAI